MLAQYETFMSEGGHYYTMEIGSYLEHVAYDRTYLHKQMRRYIMDPRSVDDVFIKVLFDQIKGVEFE